MASPISIGDAYLLCKLAFKLGRTFTNGRKSAPADLREVENQLYALSAALSSLHSSRIVSSSQLANVALAAELDDGQRGSTILAKMLENCGETLSHLERIVEQYATMKNPTAGDETSLPRRWSKKLVRDFKKIKWTTEGGDLAVLRSQLMVHINSINVVLGVVNNEHIGSIQDTLASAIPLLKEIQKYIAHGQHTSTGALATQSQTTPGSQPSDPSFELCIVLNNGSTATLCSSATLDPNWKKPSRKMQPGDSEPARRLFTCRCPPTQESPGLQHAARLSSLTLTPLSFAIRLVDRELSWMVYKIADRDNGRQVSLIIKNLSPKYLVDFEQLFVQNLSTSQARSLLRQGMGTTLAFVTNESGGRQEVLVLNRLADVSAATSAVESVTITAGNLTYSRKDVDDIEIINYAACELGSLLSRASGNPALHPKTFAHVVIHYHGEMGHDEDIIKTMVKLEFNTRVQLCGERGQVVLETVHCTGANADGQENDLADGNVCIQFASQKAAETFEAKIRQMRVELSLISLRLPRENDNVVLKLQAGGVHTEEIAMAEADISIVQDTITKSFRLIITSHDGRTVVSQKLSPDFAGNGGSQPNFKARTWVAQMLESGRTQIKEYKNGFTHLFLSDVRTNNLFEGWVRSGLWQHSLPFRSLPLLPETEQ